MSRISRRMFLAGTAAAVAAPAVHVDTAAAASVDVAIVGAGAAGIAAARRVAAARRSFRLFEASARIGGRCATDTTSLGVPFDLGAHWIRNPDSNAVLAAAQKAQFDIYAAGRGQSLRIGPRPARDAELEVFLAAFLRAQRAVIEAGKAKTDMPASRALPRDLGAWQGTIEFILGPYLLGKNLAAVSAMDLARLVERDSDAFCRQGYGALLASLAAGLPVQTATPVDAVAWGRQVAVDTPKGNLLARTVIVTASADVLAGDKIEFIPPLPKRYADAAGKLALGNLDHAALEIPRNPFDLQRDDLVFEQTATGDRTAALLANVSGTPLHVVEIGGPLNRELSAKGEAAMLDFARQWLVSVFGSGAVRAIRRTHVTRWTSEKWVGGSASAASPGSTDARKVLMEPLGGRVWFAGEAVHETRWGSVNGAWESGTRAAEAALRRMGALEDDDKPARRTPRRR
ncbi:MAG: flavin monoamine oxidase family protein [Pseudolabrys sp.]